MTIYIILKVNGLNAPMKWQRLPGYIKKQQSPTVCLQETAVRYKNTESLKVKTDKIVFKAKKHY